MKRFSRLMTGFVVAASVVILLGSGLTGSALAQTPAGEGEDFGNIYEDMLQYGLRGQWADYLAEGWEHKEKVVTAYFTGDDSILVVLKSQWKSQESELRKILEQSYNERVRDVVDSPYHLSEHHLGVIPRYVRIFIQYKG